MYGGKNNMSKLVSYENINMYIYVCAMNFHQESGRYRQNMIDILYELCVMGGMALFITKKESGIIPQKNKS